MKNPDSHRASHPAANEGQEALRPVASLISKSEKAQRKLRPGTWQHAMLRDNLKALHIAHALMTQAAGDAKRFELDDLREALRALASMIGKTRNAGARFAPGTSHHSLQRNRLKALRRAEARVKLELARLSSPRTKPGALD